MSRARVPQRPSVAQFRRYPAATIAMAVERASPAMLRRAREGEPVSLDLGEIGMCALEGVAQPFGGVAWMVRCECGRRVRHLYEPRDDGRLRCRTCLDAVYPSQRQNGVDRLYAQAFAIYDRIGTDYSCEPRRHRRPKGMHRRTYERLRRRAEELDRRALMLAWTQWYRR
jgi:hypothetical protein